MTVLCKIMMHFYLNATCIFGQPISIRCGRVKKKKEKKNVVRNMERLLQKRWIRNYELGQM